MKLRNNVIPVYIYIYKSTKITTQKNMVSHVQFTFLTTFTVDFSCPKSMKIHKKKHTVQWQTENPQRDNRWSKMHFT